MKKLLPLFVATLLISTHSGVLIYINSSFLSNFFSANFVSLIFIFGAMGNCLLFFLTPWLIRKMGKELLFFIFLSLSTTLTLITAVSQNPLVLATTAVVYASVFMLTYYCIDIFLEEHSVDKTTGETRGVYLTFVNAGIIMGPVIISLVKTNDLRNIYTLGAYLLFIPLIYSLIKLVQKNRAPLHPRHHEPIKLNLKRWWSLRNVRAVTLARFVLETFYAVMVIYTPLYLHAYIGFDWVEIGTIFTVMLLPFVLLEWPAGELADRFIGEKELMSLGFFFSGMSLLFMPFLGRAFWPWLIVLFASRVGASLIDAMTETYFFKKTGHEDTGLLSIFRLTKPVSIVFGSILAIATFNFLSIDKIFFVLAFVIFFGLKESLYLVDTK